MANNSFLLKGWSVTLVGGVLALSFKEMDCLYIFISLAVLLFFWLLDSYYLSRERLFIKLYNHTRTLTGATDFSMDLQPFRNDVRWLKCAISRTMNLFYGGLLAVHIIIIFLL
jgi:hypothetical protein